MILTHNPTRSHTVMRRVLLDCSNQTGGGGEQEQRECENLEIPETIVSERPETVESYRALP